jgi:hypothetical protein
MARLPGLKEEVLEKLRKVEQDLLELPDSLAENPQADLSKLCIKFVKEVESYAGGKPNDDPRQRTFLRDCLSHYRSLKDGVLSTRPHFGVGHSNPPHANGIIETIPLPPCLAPASPPVQHQPEKEEMSSKRLQKKAPNQGNILLKLADS